MEKVVSSDVCKETIMVLSYCEDSFVDKLPDYVLRELNNRAADSENNFYVDTNKSLDEQCLSDECKDLLGELYFTYILNSDSKKELLNEVLNIIE